MHALLAVSLYFVPVGWCTSSTCPKDHPQEPVCVELNRHNDLGFGQKDTRRHCVPEADARGECHPDLKVVTLEFVRSDGTIREQKACVPKPIYGTGKLGDPCRGGEQCSKETPLCILTTRGDVESPAFCTVHSKRESHDRPLVCPDPFVPGEGGYCWPPLEGPERAPLAMPVRNTPFCKGLARYRFPELVPTLAEWQKVEACAPSPTDWCLRTVLGFRAAHMMESELQRTYDECIIADPKEQRCSSAVHSKTHPECGYVEPRSKTKRR